MQKRARTILIPPKPRKPRVPFDERVRAIVLEELRGIDPPCALWGEREMKQLPKKISRNAKIGKRGPLMRITAVPGGVERNSAVNALLAEIAILNEAGEGWIRVRRVEQLFGLCKPMEGGKSLSTSPISPEELRAELGRVVEAIQSPKKPATKPKRV